MNFFEQLCCHLNNCGVSYAIVGGYALALHGAPRGTLDIDLITKLTEKDLVAMENALLSLGFVSRLPISATEVFRFREEYIKNRNLIAWSFYNPKNSGEIIDIIITHDLEKLTKKTIKLGTLPIYVLSKPDLIKMKRASGRPQDLLDIEALQKI